jgi:hypothetical protein
MGIVATHRVAGTVSSRMGIEQSFPKNHSPKRIRKTLHVSDEAREVSETVPVTPLSFASPTRDRRV